MHLCIMHFNDLQSVFFGAGKIAESAMKLNSFFKPQPQRWPHANEAPQRASGRQRV